METFRALIIDQIDHQQVPRFDDFLPSALPDGDLNLDVLYSSMNYKDAMAVTGIGKIIRKYPLVPGIDLVGTAMDTVEGVVEAGQPVVITGFGLGERHWGGYAQRARVSTDWIVPLPDGMKPEHAMAIGTAGFTAMLAVMAIERNGTTPDSGDVLVTGASGGVGSIAIAILAELGYRVVASTGRESLTDYLVSLGAAEIIGRYDSPPERPMASQRWAAVIDNVGGDTLANAIAEANHMGNIASIGLVGSHKLSTTVYPFILRGVNLLGIDSTMAPPHYRAEAWERLATQLPAEKLDTMMSIHPLSGVQELAADMMDGRTHGRIVIDVNQ